VKKVENHCFKISPASNYLSLSFRNCPVN